MSKIGELADVHTHLDRFSDHERAEVLKRAAEVGIRWVITAGMDLPSSQKGLSIAESEEGILASVGVHPWEVGEELPAGLYDDLKRLAGGEKVVAIGEVGLDFVDNVFTGVNYRQAEHLRRAQMCAFRRQVELACELGLPLVVHCRGAYPTLIAVLREERAHRVRGVIHNFDGDEYTMTQLLDLGFWMSIGGAITYPDMPGLRRTVRYIPLDGLLLETDAPYMPLYPDSGEKNEPANVKVIARQVARLKGMEEARVIEACYRSFVDLFGLESQREGRLIP